jgi:hypothetical protein
MNEFDDAYAKRGHVQAEIEYVVPRPADCGLPGDSSRRFLPAHSILPLANTDRSHPVHLK